MSLQTYADYIKAQSCFVMWQKPTSEELESLILPYSYCPNIAGLIDQSNWKYIQKELSATCRRINRYRRVARRWLEQLQPTRPLSTAWLPRHVREKWLLACDMPELFLTFKGNHCATTVAQAIAALDTALETPDWEIKRFGHWATPYEFITVRPGSKCHAIAEDIAERLKDYPLLDEDDLSEREHEAYCEQLSEAINGLTIVVNGQEINASDDAHDPLYLALWIALDSELTRQETPEYVDRKDVESTLEDLGFVYSEAEFTWSGSLEIKSEPVDSDSDQDE